MSEVKTQTKDYGECHRLGPPLIWAKFARWITRSRTTSMPCAQRQHADYTVSTKPQSIKNLRPRFGPSIRTSNPFVLSSLAAASSCPHLIHARLQSRAVRPNLESRKQPKRLREAANGLACLKFIAADRALPIPKSMELAKRCQTLADPAIPRPIPIRNYSSELVRLDSASSGALCILHMISSTWAPLLCLSIASSPYNRTSGRCMPSTNLKLDPEICSTAYGSWNSIAYKGGQIDDPGRNLSVVVRFQPI
jgi:hypothetical protein